MRRVAIPKGYVIVDQEQLKLFVDELNNEKLEDGGFLLNVTQAVLYVNVSEEKDDIRLWKHDFVLQYLPDLLIKSSADVCLVLDQPPQQGGDAQSDVRSWPPTADGWKMRHRSHHSADIKGVLS
ncbi:unnamed protein product [Pleuronectes platessa]|uniref:Uncharacterized protein n=1 Tax=Pleuronectes platessa TaxID=8262 RepID=A0A9N7UVK0_PLEPL|nr:unnamed protein product [Pleuronectes platessa]